MVTVTKQKNELIEQVRTGAVARVHEMLGKGADANAVDDEGQPVLRIAAVEGEAEIAALLLEKRADFRWQDRQGHAALSPELIGLPTLHRIRQHYHRLGDAGWKRPNLHEEKLRAWAADLDQNGIVHLDGFMDEASLQALQAGFAQFVSRLNKKILRGEGYYRHYDEEEHWWPRDRAYVSNNAFSHSAALARLASRPELLKLVANYLGQWPNITRGIAMRYLPDREKTHDMFGWHHDMEDQRLKMMILLTDVGPDDQYMSYVLGSNRLFHPFEMFLKNPCSLEYCSNQLGEIEIFNTQGRAGDVFVFDSNGAHRGNRRPDAALRDACFVEFSGDRSDVWGGDLPEGALEGLEWPDHDPFEAFIETEKKWDKATARQMPTWVENLPHIDSWLR